MRLPRRGCLVRADGFVVWAWEHNDPTTEFDALPPYTTTLETGETRSIARPDDIIIDLEAITLPDDVTELYRNMKDVRLERTTASSYCFKQHIVGADGNTLVVDHPIMVRINARRTLRGQPPLPTTPDRIVPERGR